MEELQQIKKQLKLLRITVVFLFIVMSGIISWTLFFAGSKQVGASDVPPPVIYSTRDTTSVAGASFRFSAFDAPSSLDFCGELVPLNEFEVRERYDFEVLVTVYRNAATVLGFKRANRWFPVIEPILKKNGVPDDFKYLAVIESNLSNAISPSKAVGFWQFLEGTGKQYGLEIREGVDERYDVVKSTEAACIYLKTAYKKFGSWTLAAASYNMGMAGLGNQLEEQGEDNYYNLRLNSETARYVLRLVFTKELFLHPEKYGYNLDKKDFYPVVPVRSVTVNTSIPDLVVFARENGTNYKLLRELNPWLRSNKLTNPKGKTYTILLPADGYDRYDDLLN